jgi:hypothetical protein
LGYKSFYNLPKPSVIDRPLKIAEMIRISNWATCGGGKPRSLGGEGAEKGREILMLVQLKKCGYV